MNRLKEYRDLKKGFINLSNRLILLKKVVILSTPEELKMSNLSIKKVDKLFKDCNDELLQTIKAIAYEKKHG